jgi:hypothetical protein
MGYQIKLCALKTLLRKLHLIATLHTQRQPAKKDRFYGARLLFVAISKKKRPFRSLFLVSDRTLLDK